MNSAPARDVRIDALRGLLLVIMAAVHVPTPLSHAFQEPAGFTSAAEGFLFIGGCVAGLVYGRLYQRQGWNAMASRTWNRARQIYCTHLALVVPAVLIAWILAPFLQPLANHFHNSLERPWTSLLLIPTLLHQPPLFDILPLYVVFLAATPLLFAAARRFGWGKVLAASATGWLAAQLHPDAGLLGQKWNWLFSGGGSFNLLAWQLLWVSGLAAGESILRRPIIRAEHRPLLLRASGAIVLLGLLTRHGLWPREFFPQDLYLWMDKWTLGPLRLLNFSAWVVLLMSWNPQPPRRFLAPLALLGRHSLAVFAFHVPLAIAATTLVETTTLSQAAQVIVGFQVVLVLFLWAAWLERRSLYRQSSANAIASGETEAPAPAPVSPTGGWPDLAATN